MKSHSGEQVNLLGSCFPVKGMSYERMLYAVRCLKSNEDTILALAGQFKQFKQLSSYLSWLEHCTGIAEVMGSNPVESPEFFRFMRQLLKLSSKCEDHIFI